MLGYHLVMHLAIGLFLGFILVPVHVTGESVYRLPDSRGRSIAIGGTAAGSC